VLVYKECYIIYYKFYQAKFLNFKQIFLQAIALDTTFN